MIAVNLAKIIFKRTRPVIRPFKYPEGDDAGDLPIIWDAYKRGLFDDLPDDFSPAEFVELVEAVRESLFETYIVEDFVHDNLEPVAYLMLKSIDEKHWQIEPHVVYFENATPRIKLRTYVAFLKKTKYRKDVGACVVRVPKDTTKLANKVEEMGLLEYVGKIWGGRPGDNDYLYSLRCQRRM